MFTDEQIAEFLAANAAAKDPTGQHADESRSNANAHFIAMMNQLRSAAVPQA